MFTPLFRRDFTEFQFAAESPEVSAPRGRTPGNTNKKIQTHFILSIFFRFGYHRLEKTTRHERERAGI